MATSRPSHLRMRLQTVAGPASSGSPMANDMGVALRPWPARFSRPRRHAGQEVTI
jgi:hypothetical protein